MSALQFVQEKQVPFLLNALSLCIISFMLLLFNLPVNVIVLINTISIFFFLCTMMFEFYRMKHYYGNLMAIFEQLDEKTLIADIVQEPTFHSGQVFYNILKNATKVMNDRISSLKNSQQEYYDYIEMWVHEVKTPITALRLILENHRTSEKIHIQTEISKIDGYVEQALYYARSSTLNQDYRIETFPLHSVVNGAVKSLSLTLIRASTQINTDQLNLKVTSDPKWIIFILKQLIDNSVKYRSPSLELSFTAKKIEGGTVLSISDNGIGINESDLRRIFKRGFTGTNGRNYARSTGMGLYLCNNLCEKLGLSIKASSQKEKGTEIQIFFPDKLNTFD
ncbi:sensor histidine kinase [Priestia megaterium]|uniref:sensor histidine kinase n=1 Tax=Priestia megaterium TaxID=1404 RepID=UPI002B2474D2|nr:sensor histidine kinase [Priestia megaterium]MEB2294591.1 sensor histidine kinase [Priestia megaterium]